MKVLFTRNKSFLSKSIRFGLNEPVSHVAFLIGDRYLYHSNLLGVHKQDLESFNKINETVFVVPIDLTIREEKHIFFMLTRKQLNKNYDFGAFLYFAWRIFLYKFFNKPIPNKNKMDDKQSYLCVELAEILPKNIVNFQHVDLSMTSPYKLYLLLKGE